MSWLDQVKNDIVIRMGDGKQYRPKWRNAGRSKEFNIAQFEFPKQSGTLVQKGEPKGTLHSIELSFDGADHLDDAEAFWTSADDTRNWVISHPFYGQLIAACTSLEQDNTDNNVSRFRATIMETISDDSPKMSVDAPDKISADKSATDEFYAQAFAVDVVPSPTDVITMQQNTAVLYQAGKKKVVLTQNAEEYFNLFNTANAYITNASAEPLAAMRAIQSVINYPSLFQDSVYNRLKLFEGQIDILRINLDTMTDPSKKRIFQTYVGTIISSMASTASTPQDDDYKTRNQVVGVADGILSAYNTYFSDLDALQTPNGGELDSFIPDADSLMALGELIKYTLSNLLDIALEGKQERIVHVDADTNILLLASRFYGLTQDDDSAIDAIVEANSIGLNQLLGIKKGTPITYYI